MLRYCLAYENISKGKTVGSVDKIAKKWKFPYISEVDNRPICLKTLTTNQFIDPIRVP